MLMYEHRRAIYSNISTLVSRMLVVIYNKNQKWRCAPNTH